MIAISLFKSNPPPQQIQPKQNAHHVLMDFFPLKAIIFRSTSLLLSYTFVSSSFTRLSYAIFELMFSYAAENFYSLDLFL